VQSITSSTFSGNQATDDEGGAIYDDYGDLQVSSSTFTNNDSSYYGGALYYESGDAWPSPTTPSTATKRSTAEECTSIPMPVVPARSALE